MTEFPDPLVPADVDLRGLSCFMLDVERLLASELVALGTPEECWAALMLWCRAWQQKPPASLPDEDRVLAAFSGAGKRWAKVKPMALRGFIKCADGRLYHPVLAAEAMKAWKKRLQYANDQERLKRWRNGKRNGDETRFTGEGETGTETVREPERQGQGQGQERINKEDYAFFGKVIRLTPRDLEQWRQSYRHLGDTLEGHLASRDAWLATQPEAAQAKWYQSTAAWLAKLNAEAAAAKRVHPLAGRAAI